MVYKVTKEPVGSIFHLIREWRMTTPSYLGIKIHGIIFSNEGAKGREPLFDATEFRKKEIFAYWENRVEGILCISAPEPGYEILAPKVMYRFFSGIECSMMGSNLQFLDVTHLDVSKTTVFSGCFQEFGEGGKVELIGIDSWNVRNGMDFSKFFYGAFPHNDEVNLNLSTWNFWKDGRVVLNSFFDTFAKSAQMVNLNIDWQLNGCSELGYMFADFAASAIDVKIAGIENWNVQHVADFHAMFDHFSPNSNFRLDLWNWSAEAPLLANHEDFAYKTFFKIKEPKWAN